MDTLTSQNAEILAHLEAGHQLTSLEAMQLFQCTRLAARVHNLRGAGVPVLDKWVRTQTGKKVKAYFLNK